MTQRRDGFPRSPNIRRTLDGVAAEAVKSAVLVHPWRGVVAAAQRVVEEREPWTV